MSRRAKCFILAEDLRTQRMLRRYAEKHFQRREIEPLDLPAGSQAGDQFIRDEYPRQVIECRRRNKGIRATVLIVHIDADTNSVQHRFHQLDQSLADLGLVKRQDTDPIALVIPKRHTETWIYWHQGETVDEDYDCKRDPGGRITSSTKREVDRLLKPFAEFLYNQTRPNAVPPPGAPDSLLGALTELRRIE